jgi:hypothetical protein
MHSKTKIPTIKKVCIQNVKNNLASTIRKDYKQLKASLTLVTQASHTDQPNNRPKY